MNGISTIYLVIMVLAVIALIIEQSQLVFRAKTNRWVKTLFLTLAVLSAIGTYLFSHTISDHISSLFLVVLLLVFTFWRQGLAKTWLISGLSATRPYRSITKFKISIHPKRKLVQVQAFSGEIRISTLLFAQDINSIQQFLEHQVGSKYVEVIKDQKNSTNKS